ncbi:TetR/AcrR family transcriptional regulator [Actinocatenispora rupis]|uniref:TetR family transcriptional regulator n=1 Tax=Actinocatenispora rupis TaxID=519421 RepID=A0A8J3J0H7_9ACTN|nr:TetR/AcrR family transcriptional regulator [Actinocatenispora rupis]GID09256.1 TetR family transcriptional regulator [Actinocatenispora rupis]
MTDEGLRERKKRRTRQAISDAAMDLFLARGFRQVSVADIAAAAEVSKPTLFKYFATKEDLLLDRIADHREETARVVRDRPAGVDPLDALHRHFRDRLADRDPVTGLNDAPETIALRDILYGTPSLAAHLMRYAGASEAALAEALAETGADPLTCRLAAAQITVVLLALAEDNWRRVAGGGRADDLHAEAAAAADHAFALLAGGLSVHFGQPAASAR